MERTSEDRLQGSESVPDGTGSNRGLAVMGVGGEERDNGKVGYPMARLPTGNREIC